MIDNSKNLALPDYDERRMTRDEEYFCLKYVASPEEDPEDIYEEVFKRSPKSHTTGATRLMKKPYIVAFIKKLRARRNERLEIDGDDFLKRLSDQMNADMAELYDEEGFVRPPREWPMIWRTGLVDSIVSEEMYEGSGQDKVFIGYRHRIKLASRVAIQKQFGDHIDIGAFAQNIRHEHTIDANEDLMQVLQEAERARELAIEERKK